MPCTACASGWIARPCGIDVDVEGAAGREAVDQLDAADLDDAVLARIEAGGFGVEDDLAHRISSLRRTMAATGSARQAAARQAVPAFPRRARR